MLMMETRTLKDILDGDIDADGDNRELNEVSHLDATEEEQQEHDETLCSECQDMRIEVECYDCEESFCGGCYALVHHGGKRKTHNSKQLYETKKSESGKTSVANGEDTGTDEDIKIDEKDIQVESNSVTQKILGEIKRQANYIPMRLTYEERHLLRLLEAALNVSEYTDKVDILSYTSKSKRIVAQLKEMCSVLAGLVVASNMKIGKELIENKNFEDNAEWYQNIFEIGRRYKIMNPERMRDSYGRLCYMVMDSTLPEIQSHMEFNLYKPIKTVVSFLKSRPDDNGKALSMLDDELILNATAFISPVGKSRMQINREIKIKESSIERLCSKYSSPVKGFDKEELRQVLYSIGDFNAYTNANRKPIIRFLERLEQFQDPEIKSQYSIGIQYGRSGARLTHDHDRQYEYVKQSLMLWSLIQREMVHLWYIADEDLYNGVPYKLVSTGQGLNRVKACPAVYKEMYRIVGECKQRCKSWIGSSVIHLGDDAVPNALFFLNKYIQVPSILIPIDQCLLKIDDLAKDPHSRKYIEDQFGSPRDLKLSILQDAFAHMFDGSGADNFYMSGSCIDGRLTSAWNHTNQIAKKPYYNFFLLSGFIGFNGAEGF